MKQTEENPLTNQTPAKKMRRKFYGARKKRNVNLSYNFSDIPWKRNHQLPA
jgi:hypothetical protein